MYLIHMYLRIHTYIPTLVGNGYDRDLYVPKL